jgi:hypothetical protein
MRTPTQAEMESLTKEPNGRNLSSMRDRLRVRHENTFELMAQQNMLKQTKRNLSGNTIKPLDNLRKRRIDIPTKRRK